VIAAIAPAPADRFVEIGPGPGVLTTRLAARAASVTAIEIDRDLAADLHAMQIPNLEIVIADVLEVDLDPYFAAGPVRVAGNLPYNISSPILFKLLAFAGSTGPGLRDAALRDAGPERSGLRDASAGRADLSGPPIADATLMLQREVADRLLARASTKEYGVLSVLVRLSADVERLIDIPAGAFRPAPKVQSTLVRLRFHPPDPRPKNRDLFARMVQAVFTRRRKTLENALLAFRPGDRAAISAALVFSSSG